MKPNRTPSLDSYFTGPLRWEMLPPNLEARVRALYYICGKFLVPTFEQWEVGFCREESPEKELQVWEEIAEAFRDFSARHELTPELAVEVVYHLMALSLGMEKDEPLYQELKRLYLAG